MADVVFETSGSTGEAQRILRSEDSLQADARSLVAQFPEVWKAGSTVVSTVPADYMFGALWCVRAPALAGCAVVSTVVASVEELVEACRSHSRVVFVTTPSFLEKAVEHPMFASLKDVVAAVVTSGSLLRGETSLAVAETLGVCPLEIYGSTEAGTVAFRRRAEGEEWRLVRDVAARAAEDGRLVVESPWAMGNPLVMADLVRMTAPGRFLLLGRADRRIKILERFVSLTAVERAFESHPFVEKIRVEPYGEGVTRLGALIVASREGREAIASGSFAAVTSRLRRDLLAAAGGGLAFPRRMRFVHALPADSRGKTTARAVCDALAAWCQEPVVISWSATSDSLAATLVFPPDATCFKGHFPGHPILPGVAQLFFLRHFALQAFDDYPEPASFRRLKFQRIIRPGSAVDLAVSRRGDGSFNFSYSCEKGVCSSGIAERMSQ